MKQDCVPGRMAAQLSYLGNGNVTTGEGQHVLSMRENGGSAPKVVTRTAFA
jgi:hypothetical protein